MQVKSVLIVEGCVNLLIMLIKLGVGLATQSIALISDAIHSLTDLGNNVVALVANHISDKAADEDHHYGHRNAEQLAVFTLAVLLIVVAIEIVINAFRHQGSEVSQSSVGLICMIFVMCVNVALTIWQHWWADRLDSDILRADSKHTLSDVLTTGVAVVGWQFAAYGLPWVDTIVAVMVAMLVVYFAVSLLRKSTAFLMDYSELSPAEISQCVNGLDDVMGVFNVRARMHRDKKFADLTIKVNPSFTTEQAHDVSEQVEALMLERFDIEDVIVHIEPALASDAG